MIPQTFNLLFFLKKPKGNITPQFPIYLRITIDGIQREFSIGRKCEPEKWNQKAGRQLGTKEEARELNHYLDVLFQKAYEAKRKAMEDNKSISPDLIRDILLGKEDKPKMILEVFQVHNTKFAELVGKEFAPGTLIRYKTSLDHTRNFIYWKYKKQDMEVTALSYDFISSYVHYLKTVRNCNQNTTAKYIANFRKIINECIKQGWLKQDPFFGFKLAKKEVKREVLSMEEIETLSKKDFHVERLNQIRDIFLFCCYTGLAYVDIKQLKSTDISMGIDGEDWIFTERQKTDTETRIPLLPFAKGLVEKYKKHPECTIKGKVLPVPSNQKTNAYLKEIADLCGITKTLTSHIARHTFATTITLSNGVPIETVSKMLGHKNLRTTQHYAKILDLKVANDMNNLKDRLFKKIK
ncbi:MAG: site-specific integrase [Bacteroidia bacterium]